MTILTQIDNLDERDLLMLADYIADKLSEDLSDCIVPGLSEAFDAVEECRSYQHVYPAGLPSVASHNRWSAWRAYRDARLASVLGGELVA